MKIESVHVEGTIEARCYRCEKAGFEAQKSDYMCWSIRLNGQSSIRANQYLPAELRRTVHRLDQGDRAKHADQGRQVIGSHVKHRASAGFIPGLRSWMELFHARVLHQNLCAKWKP
jgi:hypothetical protein